MKKLVLPIVSAAFLCGAASSASAVDLVLSHGYPTTHHLSVTYERFVKHVEENSDIKLTVHAGGALTSLVETSQALRDGVIDIGTVNPPYYLAEFPDSNLVANLSMLATAGGTVEAPGAVMAGAAMEYIFFDCDDCHAAYANQGQVYLG